MKEQTGNIRKGEAATDILCIGHITHDRIVTPRGETHLPGGTSYYFSHGMARLLRGRHDVRYRLVTALAQKDMEAVEELRREGIEVEVKESRETVYFENIYGDNPDNRRQRVRAKADPFTQERLVGAGASYIVVGPLLADDFTTDVLRSLSERGRLVLDAQGYLREVRGEEVVATDWPEKREALRWVDILKVNEHEVEVLTGESDQRKACRRLAEWGVKEVLLTLGSQGSVVYEGGRFHDIPAYRPRRVVDATGCGDTYVMGYVLRRHLGDAPHEAARFASAVASLKLEASGPFRGTEADVWARMSTHEHD